MSDTRNTPKKWRTIITPGGYNAIKTKEAKNSNMRKNIENLLYFPIL